MTYPPQHPAQPGQPMPRPMPMPSPVPMQAPRALGQHPQPQHPQGQPLMGHAPLGQPPMGQGQPPMGQPMMPAPVAAPRPPMVPQPMAPRPMVAHPTAPQGHPQQGYAQSMPAPQAMSYGGPQGQVPQGTPHQAPTPHSEYPGLVESNPALAVSTTMPDREGGERALPQLSIHAFCERNETAGCVNQMTRDWRMRRTNTKIYMGGLTAAIEFYHKENTPGLVMIETGLRGEELFTQLETLASVCDEGTRVVIIGVTNDIRLYRQLMEKGVSDYIVPPLHPLNMIRSLSEVFADPDRPFTGRAVAFYGSKGGVGSSTLAHNMAWTLSERLMQETSLIDLDSSWGTTALDFAYDSASGLEEALADAERLDDTLLDRIMVRHTSRLSILPTSSSLNNKPITDTAAYEAIITAVRSISPLAVLDVPHIWNDWTTNILTTVDDVVITTVPDLANLRNTKNLIDFLKAQRPHDSDPILILNQTGRCRTKEDEISVDNFAGAVGLEPSLVIGFDPDTFSRACNEGKMLPEMKTTENLVPGLDYISHRLRTGQFSSPPVIGGSRLKLGRKAKAGSKAGSGGKSKSLIASLLRKKA
ncbi:AAA family ATPase [Algimonas arctica]|nr:AAA family ATPase [Algimonas arctica]